LTLVRSVVLASMRGDAVVPAVVVAGAVVDVAAGAVVDVVAAGVVVDVVAARVVVDVVVAAIVVLAAVAGVSTSTRTAVVLHCLLPDARYQHNVLAYWLPESMPRTISSEADVAIVPATSIALLALLPNLRLVVLGAVPTRTSTHQGVVLICVEPIKMVSRLAVHGISESGNASGRLIRLKLKR